jgi:putative ABC transport system ATP-binding protein
VPQGLLLEGRDLRLSFGTQTILDIPALSVSPGTICAISGPSGSGKSSLLYLLSGLIAGGSGTVLWSGTDLMAKGEAARDRWRREHAGFIFQDFHLFDELSPLSNVLVSGWFSRFSAAPRRARAQALLESLGVPMERRRTSLLSRGEQQRVAIARSLLGDPPVLFADEPTASLDGVAGAVVIDTLREAARRDGRTVIVATHDDALKAVADQVVTLEHGHVAARLGESVA